MPHPATAAPRQSPDGPRRWRAEGDGGPGRHGERHVIDAARQLVRDVLRTCGGRLGAPLPAPDEAEMTEAEVLRVLAGMASTWGCSGRERGPRSCRWTAPRSLGCEKSQLGSPVDDVISPMEGSLRFGPPHRIFGGEAI